MKSNIQIIRRKLINNNIVFIDGIAKSGKIVISSIISSLKNCENQILNSDKFTDYLKFKNLGLLDENLAIDLILRDIQVFTLEMQLSRFLNFRDNDLSSVNNSAKRKDYYRRLKIKDNEFELNKIINNIKNQKTFIPMVIDDFFPSCNGKFKYFYKFKKIITLRNPLGILYENLSRNRVENQINSHQWQTSVFHYKKNNTKIPWFVKKNNINKFLNSDLQDKYIMFMKSEYKPYLDNKIFLIPKTKFFFIEDIWEFPNQIVDITANFLKTFKTVHTKKMLKILDLPRKEIKKNYEEQFYYIKRKINKTNFNYILKLEKRYLALKEKWGLKN